METRTVPPMPTLGCAGSPREYSTGPRFFPRPYDKTQTFNESIRARLKTSVRYRLARARALRRIRNTKAASATSTGNLACGYFSKFFPRPVGRGGKARQRLWSGWVV